jgi:hypothetical protein
MISRDRLAAIFGSDLDLEVCRNDIQTILGGAFQIEFAGQGRAGANGIQAGTFEFESTHQLQGATDFTGLLVLILTTANEQAGTSHSHGSGGAVLQERAAVEF